MKTHVMLASGQCSERVLVCGDPARAKWISSLLEQPEKLAENREYHSYSGVFKGKRVTVVSHGVGSAGAAICFRELMNLGAKVMIRIGTAGGLSDSAEIGDVAIATGAVRLDGVSRLMVPLEYPAIADPGVSLSLVTLARQTVAPAKVMSGIIVTSDLFYPGILDPQLELYKKAGAVAVEMECATLFILGALQRVSTGGIVVLDGNPLKWDQGKYDPGSPLLKRSMEQAVEVALKSLAEHPVEGHDHAD